MIVAHRGASYDAPENTLAAFKEAWAQGADAIEGDFYLSGDGRIVCIHDKSTKRTTGGKADLNVADVSLEELQKLDVGSWKDPKFAAERIPTLEDVLATVPEKGKIFIEIKCGTEIVDPLVEVLSKSPLRASQIVIISFDRDVVALCRLRMRQYKANWLTSYKKQDDGSYQPDLATVLRTLKEIYASGLGTKADEAVVDQDFTTALLAAGIEPHAWTINDAEQARRFQDMGFLSITTDRPQFIRKALEERVIGTE